MISVQECLLWVGMWIQRFNPTYACSNVRNYGGLQSRSMPSRRRPGPESVWSIKLLERESVGRVDALDGTNV